MSLRVLILGGTSSGRELAEHLSRDARYAPLLSFAGRTTSLQLPEIPHRVGGFGGAAGLAQFLEREGFSALVDATHAFAAQISHNASEAAALTGLAFMRLEVAPWTPSAADHWIEVGSMSEAAAALGPVARRVLLTIGRLEIQAFEAAPHHDYLIRAVDAFEPKLPKARVLTARGPFDRDGEIALLTRERIEVIVSKNAGTAATAAKLEAARTLALPLIMVRRPQLPVAPTAYAIEPVLAWLAGLVGSSER